jgi:predicted ATPase
MATALGGHTQLTGAAREALGATALRVLPHGHWRLKGVTEPIELFEIGEADAPFTPPPDDEKAWRVVRQRDLWLPVREVRHSLPAERDGFVGRHEPLQALARKFEEGARLVSVLGIGGTGKTRFVTRFAWTWLGDYPGGVWFCDLSQARTVDGIHFAVAQGLDLQLGKTDPAVQLGRAIAGRGRCLVVLDNFELVARHAEATLGRWLERAPLAQFIVTTREVLGIVGEETMALNPLPGDDAQALFVRRAKAARSDFEPGAADRAAIAQLVKVLDGLPLAIELAAARVRVMSPTALVGRMGERFEVLLSKAGRNDRQATLRAAFDWSWELLSEPEKAALAQLAVFESGFTLESAQAVLAQANGQPASAVDLVQWLVEKSFVRQLAGGRFDLLESVRDYADEHLRTAGRFIGSGPSAALAAQRRHWQHFAAIDERAATADRCIDLGNLVTATRRAADAGDAPCAVATLVRAWAAFKLTGPFSTAAGLADHVAGQLALDTGQAAWVAWIAGCALELSGDIAAARAHLERGLALARAAGDRTCEVRLLVALASRRSDEGLHDEARAMLVTARTLAIESRRPLLECLVMNGLGRLAEHQGRPDIARGHLEAALALARQMGDLRLEGGLLGNLGGVHQDQGRLDLACRHYEQALALATQVGDRPWEGNARCNLGLTLHELGRHVPAAQRLHEALSIAREIGHLRLECTVLCNLGIVAGASPVDGQRSAQDCFAAAIPIAEEIGDPRLTGQIKGYQGLDWARRARFDAARACLDAGEALLRRAADPSSLALLMAHRAEAALLEGEIEAARHAHRRAIELAGDATIDEATELGRALARLRALMPVAAG